MISNGMCSHKGCKKIGHTIIMSLLTADTSIVCTVLHVNTDFRTITQATSACGLWITI